MLPKVDQKNTSPDWLPTLSSSDSFLRSFIAKGESVPIKKEGTKKIKMEDSNGPNDIENNKLNNGRMEFCKICIKITDNPEIKIIP